MKDWIGVETSKKAISALASAKSVPRLRLDSTPTPPTVPTPLFERVLLLRNFVEPGCKEDCRCWSCARSTYTPHASEHSRRKQSTVSLRPEDDAAVDATRRAPPPPALDADDGAHVAVAVEDCGSEVVITPLEAKDGGWDSDLPQLGADSIDAFSIPRGDAPLMPSPSGSLCEDPSSGEPILDTTAEFSTEFASLSMEATNCARSVALLAAAATTADELVVVVVVVVEGHSCVAVAIGTNAPSDFSLVNVAERAEAGRSPGAHPERRCNVDVIVVGLYTKWARVRTHAVLARRDEGYRLARAKWEKTEK